MKKIFKKTLSIFSLSLIFLSISCGWNPPQTSSKEVWHENLVLFNQKSNYIFHDGDTLIYKKWPKITKTFYRIYGIDTPELTCFEGKIWKDVTSYEKKWATQALAEANKWFNINGDNILILTLQNKKTYDRNIIKIRRYSGAAIQGIENWKNDLGLFLVSQGLARVGYISLNKNSKYYTTNPAYYSELKTAQKKAKVNKKGFWNDPQSPFICQPKITN